MFLLPQLKTDTTWLKYAGSSFVDMNSYPQFRDLCEVVKCCVETHKREEARLVCIHVQLVVDETVFMRLSFTVWHGCWSGVMLGGLSRGTAGVGGARCFMSFFEVPSRGWTAAACRIVDRWSAAVPKNYWLGICQVVSCFLLKCRHAGRNVKHFQVDSAGSKLSQAWSSKEHRVHRCVADNCCG